MRQLQIQEELHPDSASDDSPQITLPPSTEVPSVTRSRDHSSASSTESESDTENEKDVKLQVTKRRDESDPEELYFYKSSDGDEMESLVL